MPVVLSKSYAIRLGANLREKNKKTVLVGGCFDILHPGHVIFLEKAKKAGDILIVFLESDEKVRTLKGEDRPIHSQKERARVLSALKVVDYVVLLPYLKSEIEYDELISKIRPDVIAVTKDTNILYHQRSAKLISAKLKFVTKKVKGYSTSRLLNH